ncbi:MAG: TonB-dependent receptor [Alphaproteobacteria bacterium]|nr:TonB-dependent receptor [Alphaproteobacteria bacterium]
MSLFTGKNRLLAGTLLAGVAFGGIAAPAAAQQQPAAPADTSASASTEIVVTGSRLRRENFSSPNPTVGIGAAEIEGKQYVNIVDAIEDIPLLGIGVNNRGTQSQNGDSFAYPDVLDLGTQRTLTLINGRRVPPNNPGTVFVPGNASGSQVDLSSINPALIDRVEIVAGTGGAIYGADAVGGVVNLILKKDFEGLNFDLTGSSTGQGDGQSGRASVIWGKNFFQDRLNLTVSADYFKQEPIWASADRAERYGGSGILNVLDGARRDPNPFTATDAAATLASGGSLNPSFLASGTDGVASTYFGPLALANPLVSQGGTVVTRGIFAAGYASNNLLVPAVPVNPALAGRAADPQNLAFFAPAALPTGVTPAAVFAALAPTLNVSSLTTAQQGALALQLLQRNRPTPYEYFRNNPNLNPLLFLGTFGNATNATSATLAPSFASSTGYLPTVNNTDPATSALFPRIAVPLAFDTNGNLVAYNPGSIVPPQQGRLGVMFGGQGYDSTKAGHSQIQAGTERMSFGTIGNLKLTDWLRASTEVFYTKNTFEQMQGAQTNAPGGNVQAGAVAVPIYVDQNPFITAASLNTINSLGLTLPTIGGQRVLFLGRALDDVIGGGNESTAELESYRFMQALEGDFKLGERSFYWDVSAAYGRSGYKVSRKDILDVEFALATDVVTNSAGQAVCRQQTLATPEAITVRNPNLSSVVIATGLVPTAAQVAACKPLNLFGSGKPSEAAKAYVVGKADVKGINTLEAYEGSFNGDLIKLPAGWSQVGVNVQKRTESAEFEPNRTTQLGQARTAPQGRGSGQLDFTEYGVEVNVPIFGKDFNFPGFRALDFSYAFRQVEREQQSETAIFTGRGTDDDTFNYSVSWKPVEELTLRGARSRTVRSASLVELVGPFTVAFTNLAAGDNPCTTTSINQGPAPATRRANCITAVKNLGIASDDAGATAFLSTFTGTAGTRPALAAGNPGLANEEANTYTLGFTYEPEWAPRLVIAADFFSVDLANEIGLVGPGTMLGGCFDSAQFPNAIVGGARACDTFLFGVQSGSQFIIPTNNAITGNPGNGGTLGGAAAGIQSPFEIAIAQFTNLNLSQREVRAVNFETRYDFLLGDLPYVGSFMKDWGRLYLRGTVYHTQRYDQFFPTLDRVGGEHGNPEYKTRLDIRQKVGKFDHTVQWFWNSESVTNILTAQNLYPEQSPAFYQDQYSYFNYFASYELNDNFKIRAVVNNVMDEAGPRGVYGIGNGYDGGVGREFLLGVSAKF